MADAGRVPEDPSYYRRASDAEARTGTVFDFRPGDQLLFTFSQAATFSQKLARDQDRFARLLAAS